MYVDPFAVPYDDIDDTDPAWGEYPESYYEDDFDEFDDIDNWE